MITAHFLLEGALYAVEQSGLMMTDAVILYDNDRYSNAIVLAAFAREELGRSRILRELRKKIVEGPGSVTLEEIRDQCDDHVKKQKNAQIVTTQRFSRYEGLGKLMQQRIETPPQSQEFKEAERELDKITKKQKNWASEDRHKTRMKALYVEPDDSGMAWNRPKEVSREQARIFLEAATLEYANEYRQLQGGSDRHSDPEFTLALEKWAERPELTAPQWPAR